MRCHSGERSRRRGAARRPAREPPRGASAPPRAPGRDPPPCRPTAEACRRRRRRRETHRAGAAARRRCARPPAAPLDAGEACGPRRARRGRCLRSTTPTIPACVHCWKVSRTTTPPHCRHRRQHQSPRTIRRWLRRARPSGAAQSSCPTSRMRPSQAAPWHTARSRAEHGRVCERRRRTSRTARRC